MILPTSESEVLEIAFHRVIRARAAAPRDAMIACLALFVKAALEQGYTLEQIQGLVKERFNSPHALDANTL